MRAKPRANGKILEIGGFLPEKTQTLSNFAETVTPETLSVFLQQLASRPEPQTEGYENLLIVEAAQTLEMPFDDLLQNYRKIKPVQDGNDSSLDLQNLFEAVVSEADFLKMEIKSRPFIMAPWLKQGDLVFINAPRGIGKTWAVHSILVATTRGLKIGSWKAENPVNCLLLDEEMAGDDLQSRIGRLTRTLQNPKKRLDILSADLMHQKGFPTPNLANPGWRLSLYNLLEKSDYGLIVIDNVAALSPGLDENSKQEWDPINQFLLSVRFLSIAVVVIHHSGKDPKRTSQRGTSAHEDALDTSITLRQPPGYKQTDGCRFLVEFTKARSVCGDVIKPFIFSLDDHDDGSVTWRVESRSFDSNAAIALLGNGIAQKEVPIMLHIDKATISKIKTKATADGLIEEEKRGVCKFTAKGRKQLGDYDISNF